MLSWVNLQDFFIYRTFSPLQINPKHSSLHTRAGSWSNSLVCWCSSGLVECWASGTPKTSRNSCSWAPARPRREQSWAFPSWEDQEQLPRAGLKAAELSFGVQGSLSIKHPQRHFPAAAQESAALQRFKHKPCKSLRGTDMNWRGFYPKILSLDSWEHGITGKGPGISEARRIYVSRIKE